MRKVMTLASEQVVLRVWFIILFSLFGNITTVKAEDIQSLEGEWIIQSSWDRDQTGGRYIIEREGAGYAVKFRARNASIPPVRGHLGLFYGSPNQIMATSTPSYDDLVDIFDPKNDLERSALRQLAGKVTQRYRIILSFDGRSADYDSDHLNLSYDNRTGRLLNYDIVPFADKTTLMRVASKATPLGKHAYQANCGIVDPNRITPFPPDQDFCPGNNLVCMTNFCGGGTGCPYVCCPRGFPYLNHCDCKCYAAPEFDCHSYSYCKEQPRQ
jgi:hypothetical protein